VTAAVVQQGWGLPAIKLILIGVLLIGSGAVTVAAFGRAAAQHGGLVETDPPA
jgi:hypothetical protein